MGFVYGVGGGGFVLKPQVHVPAEQVRAWRGMINYRRRLVNRRSAVKTQIRAFLRGLGVQSPRSLWAVKGQAWLAELELGDVDGLRREMMVEELAGLEERVKKVEKQLNRIGRKHPGVNLLRTIPGVGPRTAEAFVAWIDGADRFRKVNQFGTYLGLVPCQDASADKNRLGHITRDGPAAVRWLVCEAAWQGIRRSPTLRGFYERVMGQKADRKKIAIVATARHLVTVMGAMLKSGEVWREDPRHAHLAAQMAQKKQPGGPGDVLGGTPRGGRKMAPGGASPSRLCAASWASPSGVKVPSHEYMGPCPPGGSTLTPAGDAGNGSGYEAGGAKLREG